MLKIKWNQSNCKIADFTCAQNRILSWFSDDKFINRNCVKTKIKHENNQEKTILNIK